MTKAVKSVWFNATARKSSAFSSGRIRRDIRLLSSTALLGMAAPPHCFCTHSNCTTENKRSQLLVLTGVPRRSRDPHAILEKVSSQFNFHLAQYDGPLDLLLDLIRKQQIDINDIPIATITSQYLDYMEKAREMDIDLSAEFVYMAATLIHIKSRMLLPRDPALERCRTEEDPRQELVDRLLEHERFKNAAEMLQQKSA